MTSTNSKYLRDLCQSCSDNKVEFRLSPVGGLGGFAVAEIRKDDLIFAIPRTLILASSCPEVLNDPQVGKLSEESKITGETLLCAYMALNRTKNEYLASLPPDYTPLIPSDLKGTNVGSQVETDAKELASQHVLIQSILPELSLSLEDLINARALYNSRRYPLRFALSEESSKKRKHTERAIYDPTQGCMCPLLDVLNHQSNTQVLRFQVTDATLNIIANQDIKAGEEVFSNYDYANNDQCLLQFGYVDKSSPNVFTVQVGGQRYELDPNQDPAIPEVLLGDGGYGLEQHLLSKQKQQAAATSSQNGQVKAYMEEQKKVLNGLLEIVRQHIQSTEKEEYEEQEEEEEGDAGEEGVDEAQENVAGD